MEKELRLRKEVEDCEELSDGIRDGEAEIGGELVDRFTGEERENRERTGVKVQECRGNTDVNESANDEEEIAAIRFKSKGVFDDEDARKIKEARRRNKQQLSSDRAKTPKSPKLSTPVRKKLVDKYRVLTGNFGKENLGQLTKREKEMIVSVKRFCENEKKEYRKVISVVDSYTKDKIDSVAVVPFTQVSERVKLMTGILSICYQGLDFLSFL